MKSLESSFWGRFWVSRVSFGVLLRGLQPIGSSTGAAATGYQAFHHASGHPESPPIGLGWRAGWSQEAGLCGRLSRWSRWSRWTGTWGRLLPRVWWWMGNNVVKAPQIVNRFLSVWSYWENIYFGVLQSWQKTTWGCVREGIPIDPGKHWFVDTPRRGPKSGAPVPNQGFVWGYLQ